MPKPDRSLGALGGLSRGTLLDSYHGPIPVEDLVEDDLLMTKDDGFQPVRWIGALRGDAAGGFAPIRVSPGALGNRRSLIAAQNHRVLISDWRAELLFGEREVLIPLNTLANDTTIWRQEGGSVDYFFILMERHQLLYAEDVVVESFDPTPEALALHGPRARKDIAEILPKRRGSTARLVLRPTEVAALRLYDMDQIR
ncbi:Hint domain-containing protein [Falsirhodobacter algicola]|uniref:Hedgehog/Intein (Hint) domain-containing protein n=1 Tax=Falsirhodobacter algicola TaxID=2692330 RepID=A0A8J8SKF8_9RHOB|nr:Hint domain-containing protein [Falsirhodobacter algicola]QUS35384.1 hypothetical protein GR316_03310 [Falsirhodobacter algicola]